jgi:hypothetical protein
MGPPKARYGPLIPAPQPRSVLVLRSFSLDLPGKAGIASTTYRLLVPIHEHISGTETRTIEISPKFESFTPWGSDREILIILFP